MKTTFEVDGMHCAGCAGSVERALKRVEDIREVAVDRDRRIIAISPMNSAQRRVPS